MTPDEEPILNHQANEGGADDGTGLGCAFAVAGAFVAVMWGIALLIWWLGK